MKKMKAPKKSTNLTKPGNPSGNSMLTGKNTHKKPNASKQHGR